MLLPGFVMTLDMAFVSKVNLNFSDGAFYNAFPVRGLMWILNLALNGWIIQKIFLVALFVLLPYLAYKFLPIPKDNKLARMAAALFYAVNPFVYERFLAGQWMVLFGFALLPMAVGLALRIKDIKSSIYAALALAGVFAFSLHLGVIALFAAAVLLLASNRLWNKRWWLMAGLAVLTFAIATSYWTVPYLVNRNHSIIQSFDQNDFTAFATAPDLHLGTVGNVLALYGFWGEREPWAKQFFWVKDFPALWAMSGFILTCLVLFGYRSLLSKNKKDVALEQGEVSSLRFGVMIFVLGCAAVVFSCGIGDTPFRGLNQWLFDHLVIWRGFRDTQKWSALLVFVYAYFIGTAICWFNPSQAVARFIKFKDEDAKKAWLLFYNDVGKKIFILVTLFATLIYTFPMLGGFGGQIKPVWYPDSWKQANDLLKQDKTCKAVFLPWHMYYTAGFANNVLIANPAKSYFDCQIVQSQDPELGLLDSQKPLDPAEADFEVVITGQVIVTADQIAALLRNRGIKYVIFTSDAARDNVFRYSYLIEPWFEPILSTGDGLRLYKIADKI